MVLDNLQSMDALFGMTQTGGKPKSRRSMKTTNNNRSTKSKNNLKLVGIGGTGEDQGTGDDPQDQQYVQEMNPRPNYSCTCYVKQEGGMSKMQYHAYLAKMDVKRLYKIAKGKGIKITKKKDGKTSYIKKDTVIKKLCDVMHGKKK